MVASSTRGERAGAAAPEVLLVSNPRAGNHCAAKLDALRRSFERARYAVRHCDSRSAELDRLGPNIDLVCISGGDGTLRTTIGNNHGLPGAAPYCVFPAGTINLVAREAGYRADLRGFVPDILDRRARRRHIAGRVGEELFLCCASIGPDSHVVANVSPSLKKRIGRLAYVVAALQLLRSWPRQRLDILVDGVRHSGESVFVLKGRFYAGPWVLDDQASLASDHFRVLIMPRAARLDFVRLAAFAVFGPIFADPRWTRCDASMLEIDARGPVPIQADGDLVARTPAKITIDPSPLIFL